jgi:hypothetical protein
MKEHRFLTMAFFVSLLSLLTIPKQAVAYEKMLYWTDGDIVSRANLDGTGTQQLVSVEYGSFGWGLAIDSSAGKMYWTEVSDGTGVGKIRRSNLDGSNVENVLAGLPYLVDIALDDSAGKMYWTESYDVKCANLDGSNAHSVYSSSSNAPYGIVLDSAAGKMYWTEMQEPGEGIIQCSNLDGSQVETIVTGLGTPMKIALNSRDGKMYWTEGDASAYINYANLDGSNREFIDGGGWFNYGIALDADADKMYWSGGMLSVPLDLHIRRANLDGTGAEVITSDFLATSIAIGPIPEPASALLIGAGLLFARLRRRQS